jgi:glycosyltransferase 2 family protein
VTAPTLAAAIPLQRGPRSARPTSAPPATAPAPTTVPAPRSAPEPRVAPAPAVAAVPAVPAARRLPLGGVLRLAAVVAVVAALVAKVGSHAVVAALGAISAPVLLVALGLGALTTLTSAARWCVVARGVGLALSLQRATGDVYRATFLNSVLPAGVLGDVHRALVHRDAGDGRGARAVVIERVAGQLVVVIACLAVLASSPTLLRGVLDGLVPTGVLLGVLAALVVGGVAVLMLARGPRVTHARVAVVGAMRAAGADLRSGLLSARTGPAVVVYSLLGLGGHLALFVVAARLAGVTAPLPELLPLLVLGLLAMAIPLSVGGWGPREAVTTLAFAAAGLGAEQGLSMAVVYGVLGLASCLPGALVALLGARRAARTRP